ncbi:hypothetical protein J4462_04315 [Candidatus Pacearchaeota archaeon]|nr:hypothetical protein [Candidatus Pacearchaeota archaeon]
MVYKMSKSKFGIFGESLIYTILILIIGISLGFFIENYRTNQIIDSYRDYEVEALDLKLQNYYYQIMDETSCKEAIEQNFAFADDLYTRGLELEKFEEANQITDDIFREKKRYVLLKTELWLNSILLKEKCDNPFDTVVYFYSGDPKNNVKVAEQKVISNILKTVKEDKGNKIILLPIAGDLKKGSEDESQRLGSVELQRRIYNITKFPSIIINEETVLEGFHTVEEIEKYLRE